MLDLHIRKEQQTPEIDFRFSENRLAIRGEMYPENAVAFFRPVVEQVKNYLETTPATKITVELDLKYLNSLSAKMLFQFLARLDRAAQKGKEIVLIFRHDPSDMMQIELAEDIKQSHSRIKVNMQAVV